MSCHRQWSVTRMGQNYTPTAVLAVAIWLCVGAVGFCWVPQCSTYSHHHSNLRTWFRKALEFGLQWVTTCLTRTDAKCHMFNPIPSHATPCLKPITAIKNRLHEGPPPIKTSSFACLMYEYHMKHKKYPDLNIVYIYMIYMYILLYIYIYTLHIIYIYTDCTYCTYQQPVFCPLWSWWQSTSDILISLSPCHGSHLRVLWHVVVDDLPQARKSYTVGKANSIALKPPHQKGQDRHATTPTKVVKACL